MDSDNQGLYGRVRGQELRTIPKLKIIFLIALIFAVSSTTANGADVNLGEATKKLLNPVSDIWSYQFQNDFSGLSGNITNGTRLNNNFIFQPIMSVPLGKKFNLANRIVLNFPSRDVPQTTGGFDRKSGFGDMVLLQLFSSAKGYKKLNILGVGWTWMFPTASNVALGQEKFQVGPAAAFGMVGDKWVLGALIQQWFSLPATALA